MLRVLSKRTLYTTPNERLSSALTSEHNVAVRIKGSSPHPGSGTHGQDSSASQRS
jgi:hypothetical protein